MVAHSIFFGKETLFKNFNESELKDDATLESKDTKGAPLFVQDLADNERRTARTNGNTKDEISAYIKDKEWAIRSRIFTKEMKKTKNSTQHFYPHGRDNITPKECETKDYGDIRDLPTASVILTYHNSEKLVHILHTVHSIFDHSPPEVLHEVILVDDFTFKEELKEVLKNYVVAVFGEKVKILYTDSQLGLIKARLMGARYATGDVIVCLDAHMEAQPHWLEALVYEIKLNRRTMACSYLDWSKPGENGTWIYEHGSSKFVTVFDWGLWFTFQDISDPDKEKRKSDPTQPINTPVVVGIFAIGREFFKEIGEFDEGMDKWGGENIDLPLRVWFCGGRVVNVPCSHITHIEEPGQRNYRAGWSNSIEKNYKRIAEVNLGEYKKYFYMYHPNAHKIDAGNISDRLEIRKKCPHDFDWFIHNVYPQMGVPDKYALAWGGVKNPASNECLDWPPIMDGKTNRCHNMSSQEFFWNMRGELRYLNAIFQAEPDAEKAYHIWPHGSTTKFNDPEMARWIHWKGGPLQLNGTNFCLQVVPKTHELRFSWCNLTNPYEQWEFRNYTPEYHELLKTGKIDKTDFPSYAIDTVFENSLYNSWKKYEVISVDKSR